MVKTNEDGTVSLVISPNSAIARRQDAPVVFDMATVAYVIRPEFVMRYNSLFEGQIRAVTIPRERAIDIDTLYDFNLAECILKSRETKT
jgi:N-acylneuraminate cytidylyltransferase